MTSVGAEGAFTPDEISPEEAAGSMFFLKKNYLKQ